MWEIYWNIFRLKCYIKTSVKSSDFIAKYRLPRGLKKSLNLNIDTFVIPFYFATVMAVVLISAATLTLTVGVSIF